MKVWSICSQADGHSWGQLPEGNCCICSSDWCGQSILRHGERDYDQLVTSCASFIYEHSSVLCHYQALTSICRCTWSAHVVFAGTALPLCYQNTALAGKSIGMSVTSLITYHRCYKTCMVYGESCEDTKSGNRKYAFDFTSLQCRSCADMRGISVYKAAQVYYTAI